jgi:hypothetical protein
MKKQRTKKKRTDKRKRVPFKSLRHEKKDKASAFLQIFRFPRPSSSSTVSPSFYPLVAIQHFVEVAIILIFHPFDVLVWS